jgi:phosphoglycolate phosphatase
MEAVFFDLDGTLTDPYEGVARSLAFAFDGLGLEPLDETEVRTLIGPPLQPAMRARFDEPIATEIVRRFRLRYGAAGMFENAVYLGVPEMLANSGRSARLFVCTSKPRVYALPILRRFGLASAFERVYGSELDGTRIDKGELLAHALAEEGFAPGPAVAHIGDRALDMRAARGNAVEAWGAAWGYGSPEELAQADHVFHAPHEVAPLIAR